MSAIAMVGSRDFPNLQVVRWTVQKLSEYRDEPLTIVSGSARGVDRTAELAARAWGLGVLSIPADWSKGRGAGIIRNSDIVARCDALVAFWDGESPGTYDSICKAAAKDKLARIVLADSLSKSITEEQHGDMLAREILEWIRDRREQSVLK